jgi:hypothetical protein
MHQMVTCQTLKPPRPAGKYSWLSLTKPPTPAPPPLSDIPHSLEQGPEEEQRRENRRIREKRGEEDEEEEGERRPPPQWGPTREACWPACQPC